jgi:hypothetical protein
MEELFRGVSIINWVILALGLVGAGALVIFQNANFRLEFEIGLMLLIAVLDLLFARRFWEAGHQLDSTHHLENFLSIDLPALAAFLLILVFLNASPLSREYALYASYWTSAFVAGASALNLVLTITATLLHKAIHAYRRSLQEQLAIHS